MQEDVLVSALISDRAAYDRLAGRLNPDDFGEFGKLVVAHTANFYRRDPSARSVDVGVLESALKRAIPNPKHADSVVRYLASLPDAGSPDNIAEEYRLLRQHNVGLDLAGALVSGEHGDATDALLEKYRELGVEQENFTEKLSVEELLETVGAGNQIRCLPARLNKELEGGVLRGHSIVVYGRPESGKTAFTVNLAAGFLRDGLRVLYTGNEEPLRDLQLRFIARLSGVSLRTLKESGDGLIEAVAKANGPYDRLVAAELTTGKPAEVEALVRRVKPDVLVVDQLKNLKWPGTGNRAEALDNIAGEVRRYGKQYNLLTVMVTQAGGEAENKLLLEQTDVEWSNTGIPGAADLMIGLGVNREYDRAGKRMVHLPKNKISGRHASFTVYPDFDHSAVLSKPRNKKRRYR